MKKFKAKMIIKIGCLLLLVIGFDYLINAIKLKADLINIIILTVLLLVVIYGTISVFYVHVTIDKQSMYRKILFKKRKIMFNDVKSIKQREDLTSFQLFKAIVHSANEEIEISPVYANYKELLQLIIDRCDENVFIESNIYEHLQIKK